MCKKMKAKFLSWLRTAGTIRLPLVMLYKVIRKGFEQGSLNEGGVIDQKVAKGMNLILNYMPLVSFVFLL